MESSLWRKSLDMSKLMASYEKCRLSATEKKNLIPSLKCAKCERAAMTVAARFTNQFYAKVAATTPSWRKRRGVVNPRFFRGAGSRRREEY
jgi:hypothetical protein